MDGSQNSPDKDYDQWQKDHDEKRAEVFNCPHSTTYEILNHSSFTNTPVQDNSSTQSIFGGGSSQFSSTGNYKKFSFNNINNNYKIHRFQHVQLHVRRFSQ